MTHSSPVNAEAIALANKLANLPMYYHDSRRRGRPHVEISDDMRVDICSVLRVVAYDPVPQPPSPPNAVWDFAKAILHGDDEHRGWLLEAAAAFEAGKPIPAPRGSGIRAQCVPEMDVACVLLYRWISIGAGVQVGRGHPLVEETRGFLDQHNPYMQAPAFTSPGCSNEIQSSDGGGESRPATVHEGVSYPEAQANRLPSGGLYRSKGEEAPSGPSVGSRIETAGVASGPSEAIQPQTSPEHQSAPAYAATHNSGEGDPSVMPDYVGADTAFFALERIRDLKWVGPDIHAQMRQIASEALEALAPVGQIRTP